MIEFMIGVIFYVVVGCVGFLAGWNLGNMCWRLPRHDKRDLPPRHGS